jgi:hypothetical protein
MVRVDKKPVLRLALGMALGGVKAMEGNMHERYTFLQDWNYFDSQFFDCLYFQILTPVLVSLFMSLAALVFMHATPQFIGA